MEEIPRIHDGTKLKNSFQRLQNQADCQKMEKVSVYMCAQWMLDSTYALAEVVVLVSNTAVGQIQLPLSQQLRPGKMRIYIR